MLIRFDGNKLLDFLCVKHATDDAVKIEVIGFIVKLQFQKRIT
jgi:hypothetical protein